MGVLSGLSLGDLLMASNFFLCGFDLASVGKLVVPAGEFFDCIGGEGATAWLGGLSERLWDESDTRDKSCRLGFVYIAEMPLELLE